MNKTEASGGTTKERLLTYADLEERWGVKHDKIRRLAATGELKRVKLGHRTMRFKLADVLDCERKGKR